MVAHVVKAAEPIDEAKWLHVRAQAGKQSKGDMLPLAIPEFKEKTQAPVPENVGQALRVGENLFHRFSTKL